MLYYTEYLIDCSLAVNFLALHLSPRSREPIFFRSYLEREVARGRRACNYEKYHFSNLFSAIVQLYYCL